MHFCIMTIVEGGKVDSVWYITNNFTTYIFDMGYICKYSTNLHGFVELQCPDCLWHHNHQISQIKLFEDVGHD